MSVKESLSVNVGQRAPHLANARERGRSGFDPESSASRGGFGGGGFLLRIQHGAHLGNQTSLLPWLREQWGVPILEQSSDRRQRVRTRPDARHLQQPLAQLGEAVTCQATRI